MTAPRPRFAEIVFKRQNGQYDLLHTDASGRERVTRTYATLTEVYEAVHHKIRAGEVGYRDWRTPTLTEPFK